MGNITKAVIEISEETMDKLAGALELSPLYDEDYGVMKMRLVMRSNSWLDCVQNN